MTLRRIVPLTEKQFSGPSIKETIRASLAVAYAAEVSMVQEALSSGVLTSPASDTTETRLTEDHASLDRIAHTRYFLV